MRPYKYVIRLNATEKQKLRALKRKGTTETRLADRTRIILWSHEGVTIEETARRLGCGRDKVIFWRRRYLEGRAAKTPILERLQDQPRPGRPPKFTPEQRETVILATLEQHRETRRTGVTLCTSRDLARQLGGKILGEAISYSTITRIWEAAELKPWRWHCWLNCTDPDLIAKSRPICHLYRYPPPRWYAVVL